MKQIPKTTERLVWGGLIGVILLIVAGFAWSQFGAREKTGAESDLPIYGRVGGFSLTNQMGVAVTLDSLTGRPWVANLIFTRCPGPCAVLTRRMSGLQQALPPGSRVRLISVTADPAFDTPEVLHRYAERFDADHDRWWFLTGPEAGIKRLVTAGLKLVLVEKEPADRTSEDDLFLHSTRFILVDGQGRLRGIYDGDAPESQKRILADLKALEGVSGT